MRPLRPILSRTIPSRIVLLLIATMPALAFAARLKARPDSG